MATAKSGPDDARRMTAAIAVFLGLALFYFVTSPQNHSTAPDSYSFAYLLTDDSFLKGPTRLYLWLLSAQAIFSGVRLVWPGADPFVVVGFANSVMAAAAVLLFERLLSRQFGMSRKGSVLTAALFATSFGFWRFAGELEVYAPAALVSIVFLHAAFSLKPVTFRRPSAQLVLLAVGAALVTLFYEPLGIVAGLALPFFLLARLGPVHTLTYLAVSGFSVIFGLVLIHMILFSGSGFGVQSVLDTDGKVPTIPNMMEVFHTLIGFLQNLVSANWMFAFQPTHTLIDRLYGFRFRQELFAAELVSPAYHVFLITIPAAVILFAAACRRIWRSGSQPAFSARETVIVVWLALHALMVGLLNPGGFEAWLPSMVPVFVLIGIRLAEPLVAASGTAIGVALVAVFLVHNWFAGIAVLYSGADNYNARRGDPVIARSEPGDLLVVGADWAFERYLNYARTARTVLLAEAGIDQVRADMTATLANGGNVYVFDDAISLPPVDTERTPLHDIRVEPLTETDIGASDRIDLGEAGYVLILKRDR